MKQQSSLFVGDDLFETSLKEHIEERKAIKEADGIEFDEETIRKSSEAWRAECEARHCLNWYSLEERRKYLAEVEKKRGVDGRKYLEGFIMSEWKKRKSG